MNMKARVKGQLLKGHTHTSPPRPPSRAGVGGGNPLKSGIPLSWYFPFSELFSTPYGSPCAVRVDTLVKPYTNVYGFSGGGGGGGGEKKASDFYTLKGDTRYQNHDQN